MAAVAATSVQTARRVLGWMRERGEVLFYEDKHGMGWWRLPSVSSECHAPAVALYRMERRRRQEQDRAAVEAAAQEMIALTAARDVPPNGFRRRGA